MRSEKGGEEMEVRGEGRGGDGGERRREGRRWWMR